MTATLTLDEAGRLVLPEAAVRVLGMKPGETLRANVTPNQIVIVGEAEDVPLVTETVMENGVRVLAPTGIRVDIAAAIRAERDAMEERGLPR